MSKAAVTLCQGLPASGKSTWARKQVREQPQLFKRICRDDLRLMIDDGHWSKANEKHILQAELALATLYLGEGFHVIVDDTNLAPSQCQMWKDFAAEQGVSIFYRDFTDVPLEECIERDRKRPNYVGEKVIRRLYRDHLATKPTPPAWNPALPRVVLCDLDGTLALLNGRDPYNASTCEADELNVAVYDAVTGLLGSGSRELILLSGRSEEHRPQTENWLNQHHIHSQALYMRKAGDYRKDAIIKRELYDAHIAGKYNIICVFDDRDQVVALWRSLGLPCFQVADGDF